MLSESIWLRSLANSLKVIADRQKIIPLELRRGTIVVSVKNIGDRFGIAVDFLGSPGHYSPNLFSNSLKREELEKYESTSEKQKIPGYTFHVGTV